MPCISIGATFRSPIRLKSFGSQSRPTRLLGLGRRPSILTMTDTVRFSSPKGILTTGDLRAFPGKCTLNSFDARQPTVTTRSHRRAATTSPENILAEVSHAWTGTETDFPISSSSTGIGLLHCSQIEQTEPGEVFIEDGGLPGGHGDVFECIVIGVVAVAPVMALEIVPQVFNRV